MKIWLQTVGSAIALTLFVPPAGAVPLAPGGVIAPTGITVGDDPDLAGGVINDNLIDYIIFDTGLTTVGGNVQNRVIRSTNTSDLIFSPRIRDTYNIVMSTFEIVSFSLEGFGMFDLDVDYRTDGDGDNGFSSVSRSVSGDFLTFRFDDPLLIDAIGPGLQEESLFPSIKTDAKHFALTGSMTIRGRFVGDTGLTSVTIDGLAVPTVPLPAGFGLLLGAIGAFGLIRRRNRADLCESA